MTVENLPMVHFPSQEIITSYIKQHPATNKGEIDLRYINCVSQFFAKKQFILWEISGHVVLQIYDLNNKLKLPSKGLPTVAMNLSKALIDCAKGREIELKKVRVDCEFQ